MMTDQDLVTAFVHDRSRAAFEEILRRHGGLVFGVCRRSLGDLQEAEDAAQSVFLLFLEKAPRLGRGTILSAWLYRTAVFVSRNRIRARARRESRLPEPATPAGPPAWEEARPHLDDALARLPQRLQDALVVHYLHGKTLTETAAALDCPVKTLEKRVAKGLERLRALLAGAGVAISSAALLALLGQEAHASTASSVVDAFRSVPLPEPAARVALPWRLLVPAAAALVAVCFVAGAIRMSSADRVSPPAASARTAFWLRGKPKAVATAVASRTLASDDAAAPRPFPASFEEFAALYRRMYQFPEDLERWRALGIEVRPEDVQQALRGEGIDLDYVDQLIVDVFKAWAGRDPRGAAEWLYRAYAVLPAAWHPNRPDESVPSDRSLAEGVLDAWIANDPAAVERWMKDLPAGRARDTVLVDYAMVAARRPGARFEELAREVDALPISWSRRLATARVAEEWSRTDPGAAAAWVLKLPTQKPGPQRIPGPTFTLEESIESPGVFSQTLDDFNSNLRPLASKWDSDLVNPEDWMPEARFAALGSIARSWAATDLEAARRWSEALPVPEERRQAMRSVGERWVASDPAGALEYARGQPGAVWRDDWLELVAAVRILTDLPEARRVMDLVSPENRDEIQSRVLETLAKTRPEAAADDVLRAMLALDWEEAKHKYSSTLWSVTRHWTEKDPRAAAAWAASIEREEERTYALGVLGSEWAGADPQAALAWAAGLPASARGPVLTSAACTLASTDRALALKIAGTCEERIQILCAVGNEWARQEPQAALAWAQAQSPPQDRERCLMAVLKGWAQRDPAGASAQIGWFSEESSKSYAISMIEQIRVRNERTAIRDRLLGKEGK